MPMKEMTENNYSHLESAVYTLNKMFEINAIASLKPKTVQDYLDFSTIYYDKKNTATAIKILTDGIMKYPNERSLYEAKLKAL